MTDGGTRISIAIIGKQNARMGKVSSSLDGTGPRVICICPQRRMRQGDIKSRRDGISSSRRGWTRGEGGHNMVAETT